MNEEPFEPVEPTEPFEPKRKEIELRFDFLFSHSLLRLWHKSFNIYTDIVCAKAEPDIGSASQGFCKEMQE